MHQTNIHCDVRVKGTFYFTVNKRLFALTPQRIFVEITILFYNSVGKFIFNKQETTSPLRQLCLYLLLRLTLDSSPLLLFGLA
jgi:hypothetical protein